MVYDYDMSIYNNINWYICLWKWFNANMLD